MDTTATLWLPQQASTIAPDVDALFYFVYWISIFFLAVITFGVVYFAVKYRRRGKRDQLTTGPTGNHRLELTWSIIPTLIVLVMFGWGFKVYLRMNVIPKGAMEIKVTGYQWAWLFDYPHGFSVGKELVVPKDKPIKLLMSSKDVIHSFYVPAFRVKMDVLPNRYTSIWFQAPREGEYQIFCTEYCGKGHSEMLGTVKVVSQPDYEKWLEEQASNSGQPPEVLGEKLFTTRACNTCHSTDGSKSVGPSWKGVFGSKEELASGETIVVDENYVRESILNPHAKVVKGFNPVMPTFQGILKDKDIDALIAYMKTLK